MGARTHTTPQPIRKDAHSETIRCSEGEGTEGLTRVAAAGEIVEEGAVVLECELDASTVDDQRALPLL
jgi:hypothetical protein